MVQPVTPQSLLEFVIQNAEKEPKLCDLALDINHAIERQHAFDPNILVFSHNSGDTSTYSVVHTVVLFKTSTFMRKLIEKYGAHLLEVSKNCQTPLYYAVVLQQIEMVKTLLDLGADVNSEDIGELSTCTALWYAAEKVKNIPIVGLLATRKGRAKPDLSNEGQKILRMAVKDLRDPLIELLENRTVVPWFSHDVNDLIADYVPVEELPNMPSNQLVKG